MIDLDKLAALEPAKRLDAAKGFSFSNLSDYDDDNPRSCILPKLIHNVKCILDLLPKTPKNAHEPFIYYVLRLFKSAQETLFTQEQTIKYFIAEFGLANVVRFMIEHAEPDECLNVAKALTFEELCEYKLHFFIAPKSLPHVKALLKNVAKEKREAFINGMHKSLDKDDELSALVVPKVLQSAKLFLTHLTEAHQGIFVEHILQLLKKNHCKVRNIKDFLTLLSLLPPAIRYHFIRESSRSFDIDALEGIISTEMLQDRETVLRPIYSFVDYFGLEKILVFIDDVDVQLCLIEELPPLVLQVQIPDNNPVRLSVFLKLFPDESAKRELLKILEVQWRQNETMFRTAMGVLNLKNLDSFNYYKEMVSKLLSIIKKNNAEEIVTPLRKVLDIRVRRKLQKINFISYIQEKAQSTGKHNQKTIKELKTILKIGLAFQAFSRAISANKGIAIATMWTIFGDRLENIAKEFLPWPKGSWTDFFEKIQSEIKRQKDKGLLSSDRIRRDSMIDDRRSLQSRQSILSQKEVSSPSKSERTVEDNDSDENILDEMFGRFSTLSISTEILPGVRYFYNNEMIDNIFSEASMQSFSEILENMPPLFLLESDEEHEEGETIAIESFKRGLGNAIASAAKRTDEFALDVLKALLKYLDKSPLNVLDVSVRNGLTKGFEVSARHVYLNEYRYLREEGMAFPVFYALLNWVSFLKGNNPSDVEKIKTIRNQIFSDSIAVLMLELSLVDLEKMMGILKGTRGQRALDEKEILGIYFDALFSIALSAKRVFNHFYEMLMAHLNFDENKCFKKEILSKAIAKLLLDWPIDDLAKLMAFLKGPTEAPLLTEKEILGIYFDALLLLENTQESLDAFNPCFSLLIHRCCNTPLEMSPAEIFSSEMGMDSEKIALWREKFLINGPDCGKATVGLIEFFWNALPEDENKSSNQKVFAVDCLKNGRLALLPETVQTVVFDNIEWIVQKLANETFRLKSLVLDCIKLKNIETFPEFFQTFIPGFLEFICNNLRNDPNKQKEFIAYYRKKWGENALFLEISTPVLECLSLEVLGFKKIESLSLLDSETPSPIRLPGYFSSPDVTMFQSPMGEASKKLVSQEDSLVTALRRFSRSGK